MRVESERLWLYPITDDEMRALAESEPDPELRQAYREMYEGCLRGYMGEAVAALASWALAQPHVTRVEAETAPDNVASQRVLARVGFEASGETGEEGPRYVFRPLAR